MGRRIPSYRDTPLPPPPEKGGKPYSEYDVHERRAALYSALITAGYYKRINQHDSAREFGVSQPQISKDLKVVRKQIVEAIGEDTDEILETLTRTCIQKHLKDGNPDGAQFALIRYYNWLFNTGRKAKAPERLDVTQTTFREELKEALSQADWESEKVMKKKIR